MLEKTLESPLDCKEIKLVNPKGNPSWMFIGRTDSEAKLQYFGHLICWTNSLEKRKTLMLGKTEGRRRRGWQNEMVGWHHWLYGYEFEQAPGVDDGQGSLVCCSSWSHSDHTTQLAIPDLDPVPSFFLYVFILNTAKVSKQQITKFLILFQHLSMLLEPTYISVKFFEDVPTALSKKKSHK